MNRQEQKAYGAYAKEEELRRASSSGGIFTLLAEEILSRRGVVWGAAMDENNRVFYAGARQKDQLEALRGSKYVFLPIRGLAERIQPVLKRGLPALAVTSPCQAAALREKLEDSENLFVVDFICHGAPEERIWRQYIRETEDKAEKRILQVDFRRQQGLWTDYRLAVTFADGSVLSQRPGENPYMQAFLSNLSLREACTRCGFKGKNRGSDLTLGDFWGVNKICPEIYEKTGTSLVFVNTEKGRALWESIRDRLVCREVSPKAAARFNPAALYPSAKGAHWQAYQDGLAEHSLEELARLYGGKEPGPAEKMKNILRRLLRR